MKNKEIIYQTTEFVKSTLEGAEGGHDWWHIERIWKLSKYISQHENAHLFTVELGALLHDIADAKFYNGDETIGPRRAKEHLTRLNIEKDIVSHIEKIILNISFKGGNHTQKFKSLELDVIQDADRLDAIGAIGIARAFNYGGHKGKQIYNPNTPPKLGMDKEEYRKELGSTINHFYEKLLLLKNRMNTKTGKQMAEERHEFMEQYLEQFYSEWEGES